MFNGAIICDFTDDDASTIDAIYVPGPAINMAALHLYRLRPLTGSFDFSVPGKAPYRRPWQHTILGK